MEFLKYQHIERFGSDEVNGIEIGNCYVFPKIDGTNGQIYIGNDGTIKAGSRNRELSLEEDNAGFYDWVLKNENIINYLKRHTTHRLYGERLVPHSLKTYRDEAWRNFYVFDVCVDVEVDGEVNGVEYIPYEKYKPMLEEFGIQYIPTLKITKNGDYEMFLNELNNNGFLIKDGNGSGEGIVIKNYDFYNRFKRQVRAKIITNEFKEKHTKEMGSAIIVNKMIEQEIIDKFCTESFIEKEYAKIVNEKGGRSSKYIPMLFGKIFYELINEEMWNILKEIGNKSINFNTLNTLLIIKTKQVKKDLF